MEKLVHPSHFIRAWRLDVTQSVHLHFVSHDQTLLLFFSSFFPCAIVLFLVFSLIETCFEGWTTKLKILILQSHHLFFLFSLYSTLCFLLFLLLCFFTHTPIPTLQCFLCFASVLWDRKAQVAGLHPACVCMSVCYSLELLFSACPCGGDTTPLADLRETNHLPRIMIFLCCIVADVMLIYKWDHGDCLQSYI